MMDIDFRKSAPIFPYWLIILIDFEEANFDIFYFRNRTPYKKQQKNKCFVIFYLLLPTFSTNRKISSLPLASLMFVLSLVIFNSFVSALSMKISDDLERRMLWWAIWAKQNIKFAQFNKSMYLLMLLIGFDRTGSQMLIHVSSTYWNASKHRHTLFKFIFLPSVSALVRS